MKKSLQRKVVSAKAQNQNGHTKEHAETNKKGMKNGIAHKEEHDDDHENMVDELNGADTGYNSRLRVRKSIRKLSYESHIQSCSFDDEGELYLGKKRKGGKRKIKHASSKPKVNDSHFSRIEKVLDWRRHLLLPHLIEDSYCEVKMKHIEKLSLEKLATDVQGVFLNIDWKFKTIQDLRAIDFSPKFLTNGIVFMWSDKELLSDIIEVMAEKRFKYIENICIAMIDASSVCPQASNTIQQSALHDKTACMEQLRDVTKEPEECFMHELNDRYIKCCKKIVLMFHRNLGSKENLELRHQRNPDAFFDLFLNRKDDIDDISYERLYNTIETLLPKAIRTDIDDLKLVEMYAFDNSDMLEKASREPDG